MRMFAKTKDDKIYVVFSDNTEGSSRYAETMDLIPEEQWENAYGRYDVEYISCTIYKYADIVITDSNLSLVRNFKG